MLSLTFGNTSLAAGAVIASIMAGMGIGAALYHRFERLASRAFVTYGMIEIGIALSAAGVSSVLYGLPSVYGAVTEAVGAPWQLTFLRFASVFILLIVPSALMGATFPALCRAVIRSRAGFEKSLGFIYGLNTLGAAAGALIVGFALIETFGNLRSIWLANGINVLVGAAALWLSRGEDAWETTAATESNKATAVIRHSLPRWTITAILAGSGFATMAYEIFWMRAAKYLIGNGTYALSAVLMIFLLGLGLGALLLPKVARRNHPDRDLAYCQLGIAVLALVAVGLESLLLSADWSWERLSVFASGADESSWLALLLKGSLVSCAIFLPPTILMGLSFPLAGGMFTGSIRLLGRDLGGAYLFANLGSIVGVIAGATWLLPELGTVGGTKLVAALNVGLAFAVLISLRGARSVRRWGPIAASAVVLLLSLALPSRMAFRGEIERTGAATLRFWEEGDLATVKVLEHPQWNMRAMTIDGYIIGVNPPYGQTVAQKQLLLAHLPMALRPDTRVTLNLGLGSSTTLAMLGNYRQVDSLHCVEISEAVVEGARLFSESAVLGDPRTRIIVDDAVHFLQRPGVAYDLIVSDAKQNPRFPGNAAVLSEEFFRLCSARLAENGIIVQWVPMALHPAAFQLITRTFAAVFPDVSVYYYPPSCAIMVGGNSILGERRGQFRPVNFPGLEGYGIHNSLQVLAAQICDDRGLRAVLPEGDINSWDHPVFEFLPYKLFEPHLTADYVGRNLEFLLGARAASVRREFGGEPMELTASRAAQDRIADGMAITIQRNDPSLLDSYLDGALAVHPNDLLATDLRRFIAARGFWGFFESPGRPD
ncbi:MAG: fused MFS/spermidine synthase [Candidatus Zixiibacteriota bacterium]